MLYIKIAESEQTRAHEVEVHVGGTSYRDQAEHVISVQADGDELQLIRDECGGRWESLPDVVNKRVVNWYGDDAKFIVGNLF
jgi:hypothetical protein